MRLFKFLFFFGLTGILVAVAAAFGAYRYFEKDLPDIEQLRDVKFQIPLKVYTADRKLISQYGEKKRIPVTYDQTPPLMVKAFLAAEDDRFFEHPGVDYQGLVRAAGQLILTGEKRQGGSTITMQVARNFFLSSEKTYIRKIREIVLSLKIENELSKEQILELYLNKIYLGHRSYGIGAAAQVYYGKTLDQLSLAQIAMIAGLPKAPSSYNPITNETRAHQRRDYVLRRMLELRQITPAQYQQAINSPITAELHGASIEREAPYVAEMAREFAVEKYGDAAYSDGLKVITTIDSRLQETATRALQNTLHDYDERHGYRGAEHHLESFAGPDLPPELRQLYQIGQAVPAIVTTSDEGSATLLTQQQEAITLSLENVKWARKYLSVYSRGSTPKAVNQLLQPGDIVRVRFIKPDDENPGYWQLAQVPSVQGAFVSLNPATGAITTLVGGYDFRLSKYNRVTQSQRQPGSGFKPILYTTALEHGYTTASIINDAPVVLDDPGVDSEWRPENYSGKFFGPTRLRVALRKSRNLVSIRLLRALGIQTVIESAKRFGLTDEQLPEALPLALGSGTASPLDMARIFATFANGGYLIQPHIIERIENADGTVLWQNVATKVCPECANGMPPRPDFLVAPRIIAPDVHFLMNSLLQDVVNNGTAVKAKQLGRRDLAGKTGTTNEQKDAWFNGYAPQNIAATAWVGMDSSKTLGARETGGHAALPMWIEFMRTALAGVAEKEFARPDNINLVRIDPETGKLASSDTSGAIFEFFREDNTPQEMVQPTRQDPYRRTQPRTENIESLF